MEKKCAPENIERVLAFLRELKTTGNGKTTRERYINEKPDHLPHPRSMETHGYSWNQLIELAGLPIAYRTNRPSWTIEDEEDRELMAENRALDGWRREGLPVLESSARIEVRRVLRPGGVVAQMQYEIVSVR